MCGFVGAFSLKPGSPPYVRPEQLELLKHRGPDGAGWYHGSQASLGFRRLAIIDCTGGMQPLYSEDQQLVCMVNGEIYNHRLLRAELSRKHQFSTQSDAEVVLHGYEEWGEAVFSRLRGMFAVAIVDIRNQRLILTRDRVGKKPLYYRVDQDTLWFASELKPLIRQPPPVDRQALNDYLRFGYVPAPRTLFQGISKIPAGCMVLGEQGRLTSKRWTPLLARDAENRGSLQDWAESIRVVLADAVMVRLESEVPLGFLLSGGIDSAGVFALGAQSLATPATAFTIGFNDAAVDETARARSVADRYHARHIVRCVDAAEAPSLLQTIGRCEEPLATDALLPTDRVFAAVKEAGITTVLAGEGSDEIFAGYQKFELAFSDGDSWEQAGSSPLERYLSREEFCFSSLQERQQLLGEEANNEGFDWLEAAVVDLSPPSQMLCLELALRLPDRINLRLDRLSMAYSVEARAPFMDSILMELAMEVPHAYRYRLGTSKRILRQALAMDLPTQVLSAPKAPFRAPASWFVEGSVTERQAAAAGLVNPKEVARLKNLAAFSRRAQEQLYNLTVLHLWYQSWYGSHDTAA